MIYCYHCTCFRLSLFSDINISQGSVATLVRCGGIFNTNIIANLLTNQPVKELWKSADICRSYRKSKKGGVFFETQCSNLTTNSDVKITVLIFQSSTVHTNLLTIHTFKQLTGISVSCKSCYFNAAEDCFVDDMEWFARGIHSWGNHMILQETSVVCCCSWWTFWTLVKYWVSS